MGASPGALLFLPSPCFLGVGLGLIAATGTLEPCHHKSMWSHVSNVRSNAPVIGAGFAGLLCLLALLWTAWRHVGRSLSPDDPGTHVRRAGLVAFLAFGMATVVPVSVFLAPLFFSIIGSAAYGRAAALAEP